MLVLRKRLSYKQAKLALLLVSLLSLMISTVQVFSDWKEEKAAIQRQVMSTLHIIESAATEAAHQFDEDFSYKILQGLMQSDDFHKATLEDGFGKELASTYRPLVTHASDWFTESVFTGLPHEFHLPLKYDGELQVGMLTVEIDSSVVKHSFVQRNARLLLTYFISALLLGAAMFLLFYFQTFRPFLRFIDQLSFLEKAHDHPDQLQFKLSSRDDELGILARTITALWHKRLKTETELAKSEAYFKAVLNQSSESMLLTDLNGKIIDSNKQTTRLLGYDTDSLHSLNISHIDPILKLSDIKQWLSISSGEPKVYDATFYKKNGDQFPVEVCGNVIRLDKNEYYFASFRDITQRKKNEEKVKFLAYFDALTGLPNRRYLNKNLDNILAKTKASGHVGALIFLDLDRFKNVNDSMGHHVGDALLKEVATRISGVLSESDIAARIGGDEFVVLLPMLGATKEEAHKRSEEVANTLLCELSKAYILEGTEVVISASIGISFFPTDEESGANVLLQADAAMYESKGQGRSQFCFYRAEMKQTLTDKLAIEKALRSAIDKNELHLVYQPQVDQDGALLGLEALLRWKNEELGMVPPDRFIPVAEETGCIVEIGNWVLDQVCQQLKLWQAQGLPSSFETVAINISPYQFVKLDFVDTVKSIIERHQIDPTLIDLEITESMLVEDMSSVTEKMHQLKALGIRFSVDDFGTGYSSLRYIQHFPLAQLKIDQAFVRDILNEGNNTAIISTIVSMSSHLGLSVLAEGVESQEEKALLHKIGCKRYQGYYFSRPLDVNKATQCLGETVRFPF